MPEEQLCPHQVTGPGAVPHAAPGQAGGSHCLLRWWVASLPAPCSWALGFGVKAQLGAWSFSTGSLQGGTTAGRVLLAS